MEQVENGDWCRYKALCERPDYFSRWALTLTCEAVPHSGVRSALEALMAGTSPLEKPAGHKGSPETDFYRVGLDLALVEAIIAGLAAAVSDAPHRERRRLGHLRVVWQEFAAFLAGY